MSDKMREALEEVCRVLESNDSAIVDTIWVSTGQPETLLDHCKAALEVSEPAQVSQPVDCFVASDGVHTYCNNYGELIGFSEDAKIAMYSSPPDYEALKARIRSLEAEINRQDLDFARNIDIGETIDLLRYEIAELKQEKLLRDLLVASLEARVAELESATEHLGLTPQQAKDGLARYKASVAERDRLQSDCDRLKEELNAWKIGFGSKAK